VVIIFIDTGVRDNKSLKTTGLQNLKLYLEDFSVEYVFSKTEGNIFYCKHVVNKSRFYISVPPLKI
jgi:hypothetical protein